MAKTKHLKKVFISESLQEITPHGSVAFPLQVYFDELDYFDLGKIPWHCHPEIEFEAVLYGSTQISTLGKEFTLQRGDGLFINSNALHETQPLEKGTISISVVFSPKLLHGFLGSVIEQKYVSPLVNNPSLGAFFLNRDNIHHANIIAMLRKVFDLHTQKEGSYELEIVSVLTKLWVSIYDECKTYQLPSQNTSRQQDEERIRKMLDFIHQSYAETLSLHDIAAAANISTSECCRCFKRILKTTPFGYLNHYRLAIASELLRKGFSVTHTFKETGFGSQSYFGMQFKSVYGCTPGKYKQSSGMP